MLAGRFNDQKSFKDYFVVPIKKSQQCSASDTVVALGNDRTRELRKIKDRYLLGRDKGDVLKEQLMGKEEVIVYCEMTPLQKQVN